MDTKLTGRIGIKTCIFLAAIGLLLTIPYTARSMIIDESPPAQNSLYIIESQITDLLHTTDTNASTACSGVGTYLDGEGGCNQVIDLANFTDVGSMYLLANGSVSPTGDFDWAGYDITNLEELTGGSSGSDNITLQANTAAFSESNQGRIYLKDWIVYDVDQTSVNNVLDAVLYFKGTRNAGSGVEINGIPAVWDSRVFNYSYAQLLSASGAFNALNIYRMSAPVTDFDGFQYWAGFMSGPKWEIGYNGAGGNTPMLYAYTAAPSAGRLSPYTGTGTIKEMGGLAVNPTSSFVTSIGAGVTITDYNGIEINTPPGVLGTITRNTGIKINAIGGGTTSNRGIWINSMNTGRAFYSDGSADVFIEGNIAQGTNNVTYPIGVYENNGGIGLYVEDNISAGDYLYHSITPNFTNVNVKDYLHNWTYYIGSDGKLNHSKEFGYIPTEVEFVHTDPKTGEDNKFKGTVELTSVVKELQWLRQVAYDQDLVIQNLTARIEALEAAK